MGGEPADDFVHSWVDHIARQFKDEEMKGQFWLAVNKVLKPFISDRGLRWEMHVCARCVGNDRDRDACICEASG